MTEEERTEDALRRDSRLTQAEVHAGLTVLREAIHEHPLWGPR